MSATSHGPSLSDWLEARRAELEVALDRFLPRPPAVPAVLSDAMRYSLLDGGKRFRPALVLAAAEAVSRDPDAVSLALPAACALECVHTYSLIHDDLPAMDNDTLRRGRPTSHVVFGEGLAVLAGDGLLTEAMGLLAREPAVPGGEIAQRKLATLRIVAEAAGAAGMVGGQALDLAAAGQVLRGGSPAAMAPMDADALRAMHGRKTGALIRASALAGATMAGGTEDQIDAVGRYAAHLGLAFQIVDDILDVEGVSAELGKTAGKDAAAHKPTYPSLFGLAESHRLAETALEDALAALDSQGLSGRLVDIAHWVVRRSR
jgi:geranylgeranyl diphosphate synthase type II